MSSSRTGAFSDPVSADWLGISVRIHAVNHFFLRIYTLYQPRWFNLANKISSHPAMAGGVA
jgi:hypothetical protein